MLPPFFYPSKKLVSGKEYPRIFKKYLCSGQNIKEKAHFVFLFAKCLQIFNDFELLVLHS